MGRDKVLVSFNIGMQDCMKGNGSMIIEMVEEWKDIVMVTNMKENLRIINQTEREFIHGLTVKFMKANGNKDLKKDKVSGKVSLEIHI